MKKLLMALGLLTIGSLSVKAQGVEGFIIEKFYVTNAADNAGNGTTGTPLPTGSVVWRFYVDMAAGYELQSVYGDPNHTLEISTTTAFFNNVDRGEAFGHSIGNAFVANNTNYIDSYLSMGGVSNARGGVLKTEDDGVNQIAFGGGYIQNNDPSAGQPVNVRDGAFGGAYTPVAITPAGLNVGAFGPSQTPSGATSFTVTSGAWATTVSCVGPTATNRVLIAQITSDGVLTYAFNVQVREIANPTNVQNYVPSNPQGTEQVIANLAGVLNQANAAPLVNITAPLSGATYLVGNPVNIIANASDPDGDIDSVRFFVDGNYIGSDLTGTGPGGTSGDYTFTWTAVNGAHVLTARAYDDASQNTLSSPVNISVGNIVAPTVTLTSPIGGTNYFLGASVPVTASVTPGNSAITQVEFFANGGSIGVVPAPGPYTINWTANILGTVNLTAVASDANLATGTSPIVSISVFDPTSAYVIETSSNPCAGNIFCLPISAISAVDNVIGYDIVLEYDNTRVQPTGVVTVAPDLINPALTSTANSIDNANGLMYISVFFNASAPPSTEFNGTGELLCVQFARTSGFGADDTADFSISQMNESYFNGVQPKVVSPGEYITFQETEFNSSLKFWSNNSAIGYDGTGTTTLITNIYGNNNACTGPLSAAVIQPDGSGNFTYDYANGPSISIQRDILGTTSVQPVVNGFDAFLTRRVLINDVAFIPSVYQMIAMDVNIDGLVSAGDLSQINQRAVLFIPEFKQAWNYTPGGTPIPGAGPSKDWVFIDGTTLTSDPGYVISANYPFPDGLGFDKFNVPVRAFCLEVPYTVSPSCNVFGIETYTGILVGDVNGNYATVGSGGTLRTENSNDRVVFDLSNAVTGNGYIDVPVAVISTENVNSLDFALQFNESKMTFGSVINHTNYMETLSNFNTADKSLRFTSYSLQNYDMSNAMVSVRFATQSSSSIEISDLLNLEAYINGEQTRVEVSGKGVANGGTSVQVFPNPANSYFNLVVSEDASMELMDANGRLLMQQSALNAYRIYEFNTSELAKGIYLLKVYSNSEVTVKKVIID